MADAAAAGVQTRGPRLPPAGEAELALSVDPIDARSEPKRSGGVRRMAALSRRDHARWTHLAGRIAAAVEPRLSAAVLGNRAVLGRGTWHLAPWQPALAVARTAARRLGRGSPVLVRTDVTSFYPSVDPSALFRALLDASADRAAASHGADLLEGWGGEGYVGLPIGPPGSAIMANAVLRPVDAALEGIPFLRWVDDYLLGARSDRHAAQLVDKLDEALDCLGLRRAPSKTTILAGSPALIWPGGGSSLIDRPGRWRQPTSA
jgi:hypothetical protein